MSVQVEVCVRGFGVYGGKLKSGQVSTGLDVGTRIRRVPLDTVRTPPIRETVRNGRRTLAILKIVTMLSGCAMICSTQQERVDSVL